jgi:hypothetical protein
MNNEAYKNWRVIRTVELNAPAQEVWDLVGGFFNLHKWHPDIVQTEVLSDQTEMSAVRRLLTFPGQPKTTEELIFMDNENFHYRYKWHEGEWGEKVQRYVAEIKVLELELDQRCVVQWSSTFYYFEDALTQFYQNGFDALSKKFG